jgi:hypothetical protein
VQTRAAGAARFYCEKNMCKWGTSSIVWIATDSMPGWRKKNGLEQREDGRWPIPVDACIAEYVQKMNDLGIATVGCCCGHGKTPWASILVHPDSESLLVQHGYEFSDYHITPSEPRNWLSHLFVAPEQRDPREDGCLCQACGVRFRGDLMVADEVWAKIRYGSNVLCPTCMMNRLIDDKVWSAGMAVDVDSESAY